VKDLLEKNSEDTSDADLITMPRHEQTSNARELEKVY